MSEAGLGLQPEADKIISAIAKKNSGLYFIAAFFLSMGQPTMLCFYLIPNDNAAGISFGLARCPYRIVLLMLPSSRSHGQPASTNP
jgi:hypothetical protein